jgi:hypothetical protein
MTMTATTSTGASISTAIPWISDRGRERSDKDANVLSEGVEIAASSVSDTCFLPFLSSLFLREYGASTAYSRLFSLRDNRNGKDIGIKTTIIPRAWRVRAPFSSGTVSPRMNPRVALSREIFHSFPRATSSNKENTFRIAKLNSINKRDRRETSASDFLRESKLKIERWTARKRTRELSPRFRGEDSDAGGGGRRRTIEELKTCSSSVALRFVSAREVETYGI